MVDLSSTTMTQMFKPSTAGNIQQRDGASVGVFGGYTHHWLARWSSTVTYGYLTMDDTAYAASLGPAGFHRSQYASLNLIFRPFRWLMVGVEGLWGYNQTVTGDSGQAWRGQANAQFTF